jgi:hypothetical protein
MKKAKEQPTFRQLNQKFSRGQGLIETALLFPILLIVLSGLVEVAVMLNEYLALQDATRNAARFSSDGDYKYRDASHDCSLTRDFYRQTSCLVNQELRSERPMIQMADNGTPGDYSDDYLDPNNHDDIVVSAFALLGGTGVTARFPWEAGELGWSYAEDLPIYMARNASSSFSSNYVTTHLISSAPSTGVLLVEVFYNYKQKLKLPWITAFIPDPLPFHIYAFMPLVSAEPTATPRP